MPWYPGKASRGAPVIPYGPGMPYANEAAVVAAFPVGSVVYDMAESVEANRMKRIKYVANLDGVDTVDFGFALPANGTTGPWELEWLMAVNGIPDSIYSPMATMVGISSSTHWRVQLNPSLVDGVSSIWRTSTGTAYSTRRSYGYLDGRYHKHRIIVTADLRGAYFVDGIQQDGAVDLTGWNPGTTTSFMVFGSAASGTLTFTKICNMVASREGVVVANIPFTDGAGTIVTDKSGNGYHGSIIDGTPETFWGKACIPLALGG